MQNGDKALPRKFYVANPSHNFPYICLDIVKMYKNPLLKGNLFQNSFDNVKMY